PADTEPPVIADIADIAVDTDAGANTASVVLTATITDNSGEAILPVFSIDGTVITSPYDFAVGTTTVFVDAQDSAGNKATQQSFVVTVTDMTPPNAPVVATLTATPDGRVDLAGTAEPGSTVTITFPDGSTGSVTADASTGTFAITSDMPQQSGMITLVAADFAGNDSALTHADFVGDDTPPTISIGALSGPINGTYTAAISISEDSTDFGVAYLTLENATATLTGSGRNYTAILTPDADGTITLSVAAGTFTDAAGNANEASNTVSAVFDGTAPTVSISGAPEILAGDSAFSVTITFSERVTGFVAEDIRTTNATVIGLSGGGASYAARLRASGAGDAQVSVPANVAVDAVGNGNLASNQVGITDVTVERTQERIASYMQTRANQLISNQPGLIPFLSGTSQRGFSFAATRGAGIFDFATGTNYPVWAQLNGSWAKSGDSRSEYVFGALGGHRAINENLLVGVMLQFDHLNEDTGISSVRGTGWMVGPYFVAQSATQPLYFEGRLLYGETRNKISPFGTYEDSFDTKRMLAQLKVAGELSYGTTILSPFLNASYTTDDQQSYIDSLGNAIPEQGIALGQIEIGMDFSTMMPVSTGELELLSGFSGIWSHTNGSGFASTVTPDYEGGRARVELGINYQIYARQSFTATTYYDGIGASSFESYGLSLDYEMQF
ncbi:Ig-like domain-containing protein, partial [Salipiger aestuarii]